MSTARDISRLELLIADERLSFFEREAFESMLRQFRYADRKKLSEKQADMVARVSRRLELDADEPTGPSFASGTIPMGAPVEVPEVLRNLPKSPPGRRAR